MLMNKIFETSLKLLFPTIQGLEFWATGSQIYGYATEGSDYDVIVDLERKNDILEVLKSQNIDYQHSNVFDNIRFKFLNIDINMIFLNPKNRDAWISATQTMCTFREFTERVSSQRAECLVNKKLRCDLFSKFVLQFGGDPTEKVYDPNTRTWSSITYNILDETAWLANNPGEVPLL